MLAQSVRLFVGLITATVSLTILRGATPAPATKLPAEIFFEPPGLLLPRLSPDGSKLCVLSRFDNIHYDLTLIEVQTMKQTILARPLRMTVANFWWKNDDLLLFLAQTDDGWRQFKSLELHDGKLHELPELGYYQALELINVLPDDPEQMLFRAEDRNSTHSNIIKVNLRTGKEQVVELGPEGTYLWFTNQAGEAIAGWGADIRSRAEFLLWRAKPADHWQRRPMPENELPPLMPFGVTPDGRRLLVKDYRNNSTSRVCVYDPVLDTTAEEVAPAREVEPDQVLNWGYGHETGAVTYPVESNPYHFLNAEMKTRYELVEKLLPGAHRAFVSYSKGNQQAIVFAHSDRNPGGFCLLDFPTGKMKVLGLFRRSVNPAKMAAGRNFSFTTSDGLTVTGRITLPAGEKKPPLIVQLGPYLTNPTVPLGFYPRDQFFASRGYATVRINYRGTSGFGRDFTKAGDLQIAGMARDVEEGVKWLDAQGWIDGGRVALLGENWGGLIAFPLATRNGQFKALLNFDSVIDTKEYGALTFSPSQRTANAADTAVGGRLVGEAYAAQWSPLNAVPQLTIPSFHHYTSNILGSSTEDADKLKNALKKTKQDHEFSSDLCDELMIKRDITPWKEKARQFEAAVEFLNRHLGIAEQPE